METNFKGSPLETDLRNAFGEKLKMYLTLILIAIQNQPHSIFWKDALEFALTKTK
jgi:hypothetical protein